MGKWGWGQEPDPVEPRERYRIEVERLQRGPYRFGAIPSYRDWVAKNIWESRTPGRRRDGPVTMQMLPQDKYSYWEGRGSAFSEGDLRRNEEDLRTYYKGLAKDARRFR